MADRFRPPVAALLGRSLAHVAAEVPAGYRRLADELGTLVVALTVDGERFAVRGGGRVEIGPDDGSAPVRVTTSRSAVLAVLDADTALAEAVESGAVQVQGPLDEVVRAHDALMAYAHAAVRAPSVPGLLEQLR